MYAKHLSLKRVFTFLIALSLISVIPSCSLNRLDKKSAKELKNGADTESENLEMIDSTLLISDEFDAPINGIPARIIVGAERTKKYISLLKGKRVAIVGNQTSMIKNTHLVDSMINSGINVVKVFSPEHGFRGVADAGQEVNSSIDAKTGIPIVSLYGNNRKPTQEQMSDVDIILFDIQDVGVRFYTYISTLHYVMETAAEAKIPVLVLDRPNPNGHYIDGPILDMNYKSFVGMHPIPIVYGMTIGEFAEMINMEGWLSNGLKCDLGVVPLKNYTHQSKYSLPVPPSPNLKSDNAINLYPSLCLFEGTGVSIGRGTLTPFEIYGHPNFDNSFYSFTPIPMEGATDPKLKNQLCFGFNLTNQNASLAKIDLSHILNAQTVLGNTTLNFDAKFFNLLAGNNVLINQIQQGMTEIDIKATWKDGIDKFKEIRKKYLIYP